MLRCSLRFIVIVLDMDHTNIVSIEIAHNQNYNCMNYNNNNSKIAEIHNLNKIVLPTNQILPLQNKSATNIWKLKFNIVFCFPTFRSFISMECTMIPLGHRKISIFLLYRLLCVG